jgi:hypothetical protein
MNTSLIGTLKTTFAASLELIIGEVIADSMETMFNNAIPISDYHKYDEPQLRKYMYKQTVLCSFQVGSSMMLAWELLNLLIGQNRTDLTGLVLMHILLFRQKGLWERIDQLKCLFKRFMIESIQ